jgi:FtsZ-binding cell division protein ZapB
MTIVVTITLTEREMKNLIADAWTSIKKELADQKGSLGALKTENQSLKDQLAQFQKQPVASPDDVAAASEMAAEAAAIGAADTGTAVGQGGAANPAAAGAAAGAGGAAPDPAAAGTAAAPTMKIAGN